MLKQYTFKQAAETLQKIEDTRSRLEMTDILVEMLNEASSEEAQIFSYLLEGRVAPLFIPAEFNYSDKSILNLLEQFVKANHLEMDPKTLRKETGDIGLTVEQIVEKYDKNTQKDYTLEKIYEKLWEVVLIEGTGSVERKANIISNLIKEISPVEAKFLSRIVAGKLRVGSNVKTVLDALSVYLMGEKDLRDKLDKVYGYNSDIGFIVDGVMNLKEQGKLNVETLSSDPIPGIPVLSRLVQRVGDLDEAVERMLEDFKNDDETAGEGMQGKFILQPKFDGMRCQIHKGVDYSGEIFKDRVWNKYYVQMNGVKQEGSLFGKSEGSVKLFSRNLEDLTKMFPDIVEAVEKIPVDTLIIDTEIVGVKELKEEYISGDKTNAKFEYIPFQTVMTRRRKYDVESQKKSVPVVVFAFDLLKKGDENSSQKDTEKRVDELDELLNSVDASERIILASDAHKINTVQELEELFELYVNAGLEGVIVKKVQGSYTPGVRNYNWIKIKKSIQSKVVDTIDVVLVGYYYGSGKRSDFGMGALLCAVYNSDSNKFVPITKLGTGIADDQWKKIKVRLDEITVGEGDELRPKSVEDGDYVKPDVWVEPEVVCEIEADEVTKSSIYEVGKGELGYGLGLRFPRLMRFDRDKRPVDATTEKEVVSFFKIR